jgi:L-ectoine synthase
LEVTVIVRRLADITGTVRDVDWGGGRSRRFLLAGDGLGFTVTDTLVSAGTESRLRYANHIEACYCIEGAGEIEQDGVVHALKPGTLYALNRREGHVLRAHTTLRLICVFHPALEGPETHDLGSSFSGY